MSIVSPYVASSPLVRYSKNSPNISRVSGQDWQSVMERVKEAFDLFVSGATEYREDGYRYDVTAENIDEYNRVVGVWEKAISDMKSKQLPGLDVSMAGFTMNEQFPSTVNFKLEFTDHRSVYKQWGIEFTALVPTYEAEFPERRQALQQSLSEKSMENWLLGGCESYSKAISEFAGWVDTRTA